MKEADRVSAPGNKYRMRLFVVGGEPNSVLARKNLQQLCETRLPNRAEVRVVDVMEDFTEALAENILVTPVLLVDHPRRTTVYGSLQDHDRVLGALGLT